MDRMYSKSRKQWNPFVGCEFDCVYCKKSFQAQLKRTGAILNCPQCTDYEPHTHAERFFNTKFPRTRGDEFIFTCSTGDISFCSQIYREKIYTVIRENPDRNFLIQTKDPGALKFDRIPYNVILGTTIETNREKEYKGVSGAPVPLFRFFDFIEVKHPRKMVTIEPIIDFDTQIIVEWMCKIKPIMVWIGYDSRRSGLIEPPVDKVMNLIYRLRANKIKVIEKLLRAPHARTNK